MAYEVVMSYHLHMPSYFLGTFTEYPFKVQRLIQREEFAVLLSFDRLNWNNAKIVKNNNMTKFRYITHCFFEVFVLS